VALIVLPSHGLPRQVALDQVPTFMTWLRDAEGNEYRSYGIWPDGSSIGQLQDIGVVGPLAPYSFRDFVELIADDKQSTYFKNTMAFIFAGYGDNMGMGQYRNTRPILDWVGLKYLVLDRAIFNPGARRDEDELLQTGELRLAYQDDRVVVLESPSAQEKAIFETSATVLPDRTAVLLSLKSNPGSIDGPPKIEANSTAASTIDALSAQPAQTTYPVTLDTYDPNFVRLTVDAPASGLVVLKDAFAPGWFAQVDGQATDILRVNGFARGVFVPAAGRHVVEMYYRPVSFMEGAWLSGLAVVLLIATSAYALLKRTTQIPLWSMAAAVALILAFCVLVARTYFG
jgi:hypothetical protein